MTAAEHFLQRCLQLAKKGINHVSPNPMVGCVITIPDVGAPHGERIIGEGYHQFYGGPHAEVNAIQSVRPEESLENATLYVSLEPCNHYGKTPPCSHLIVEKGIKRVVVGTTDPNPLVAGKGIDFLRNKGIEVTEGVLEGQCEELNLCFNTFYRKGRPYIILKWAQTRQKHISDLNFNSKWISNRYSRQLVHKWRSEVGAIMVGTQTAFYDNPSLTTRLWGGSSPTRIFIDRTLKIPTSHHLLDGQIRTLVLNQKVNKTDGHTEFVKLDRMEPKEMVQVLTDRKINSVLIEGGSKLLQSFIDAGLWDEARIFTGEKEFEKGIDAPHLSGSLLSEINIINDKLQIITN